MKKQLFFLILCLVVNLYSQDLNQELLAASRFGDRSRIVNLVKIQGANVNTLDKDKQTPLMLASLQDNVSTVEQLLEYGARLNEQDIHGNTALMLAIDPSAQERITENTYKISEILLEHGANPLLKNKQGETALDFARQKKIRDKLALQAIELLERYMHKFLK